MNNGTAEQPRILLLHTKTAEPEVVEAQRKAVIDALRSSPYGAWNNSKVLLAREDWEARVGATEGWSGWEKEVSVGCDLYTSEPHYHGYVITERVMGKATYEIVDMVLQTGKPIWILDSNGFSRVRHIRYLGTGAFRAWGEVTIID